ncbi:MAG: TIGR04372 family glycosyltransferase [Deltaproteobacteria bacterium]|nr:TIGR04372 family glycosyltransferase [Deltaproteobacteria bacterium]
MNNLLKIGKSILRKSVRLLAYIVLSPIAIPFFLLKIRFFEIGLDERIGHLAYEPDLYLKTGILGWRPKYWAVLLAQSNQMVNKCLIDYWSKHISVIRHPLLVKFLRPFVSIKYLKAHYPVLPNGFHTNKALRVAQARYEAVCGGTPLLTLSAEHRARGWQCLQSSGVPRDAWFVCLHVREAGYLPELKCHSYRDADVMTYLPAIKFIVSRGGWVIRMGDPTMKPLPPLPQVIDYAHSPVRSDWMDIFCCAQCRFLLGTNSELFLVSYVFGVPGALTNFTPAAETPYSQKDLFIPKLYYSEIEKRMVSFQELFDKKLSYTYRSELFDEAGIILIDNSEEEILDFTKEMLERLNGTVTYTPHDQFFQEQWKTLILTNGAYPSNSRLGKDFLRNYADLIIGHNCERESDIDITGKQKIG